MLIAVAALLALRWLSEIVPDLLAGGPSRSASTWQIPTNPVHVLELAFLLPACVTSGILLLRGHRWGFITAPGLLAWLALTSLPTLVTPLVASARGDEPGWAVVAPVGAVLLASLAALASLVRAAGAVVPGPRSVTGEARRAREARYGRGAEDPAGPRWVWPSAASLRNDRSPSGRPGDDCPSGSPCLSPPPLLLPPTMNGQPREPAPSQRRAR